MINTELLKLLIAAFTGAVGALFLRSVIRLAAKIWKSQKPIALYDCALEKDDNPGVLRHGWGKRIIDSKASNKQAWEHSWNIAVRNGKEHTVYGPYTNDFGQPGFFKIVFRISGTGFSKSNKPILAVDVIQAPFGGAKEYNLIGQKIIYEKDIKPYYKEFSIIFYTNGTSVYEYRCTVLQSNYVEDEHTLRFDNIKVHKHISIWDIF